MTTDIDMTCPICHRLSLDSNTDNDDVAVVVCHRTCLEQSRNPTDRYSIPTLTGEDAKRFIEYDNKT